MPRLAIIDQSVSAGGVERFLYGLVEGVLELPEAREWDVTVLLNRHNSANEEVRWPANLCAANLRVSYLFDGGRDRFLNRLAEPGPLFGIPGSAMVRRRLSWLLNRGRPRVVRGYPDHARKAIQRYCRQQNIDLAYFAYPYWMQCPDLDMPVVTTSHDFNWKHRRFSTIDKGASDLADRLTPQWFASCRRLVVSSEFIASELRYFYPSFATKTRVVRLGIPGRARVPTTDEVNGYRRHADLPPSFLLSTGWIAPHKNQVVLFEALAELRHRGIGLPLVLVGPHSEMLHAGRGEQRGSYAAELTNTASRHGLSFGRDFWALGFVDDFELESLYRAATALVLPSLYEAGSFSLLEAVRARCPVICSAIPAHAEQADLLGNNVWMFNPYDPSSLANAVASVLAGPDAAAARAAKAAALVDQSYSWKKAAAGYLRVFHEALEDPKGS